MTVSILITEDHELFRDGLRRLVEEAVPGARIIEAGDYAAARAALAAHPDLDLLLLDMQIPGTRGLDGLKAIKGDHPALPVVVISTVDHQASVQGMLAAGADGFIGKAVPKAVMIQALHAILDGELVVLGAREVDRPVTLSPRQSATLELLALGLPNKEIATRLDIAPATVREYVSDLLALFECDNRTQVVLKARRLGFILD
ncbi:response regulator [Alloalcanivorax marinus]|uniref:response regulator n=1 Tax=Alloalcanivorax marinus TaxID=1177169 RepID=UPI0019333336|nr:response regulator transcription factor [Alloalcanivorax marinus]MBL7249442.1 response regulator transcription factor [Alloalcanivorax marinus]